MTTPNRPPLWEAMHEAFWRCPKENWRLSSAYMIRAVRDWLVPEEGGAVPDGDLTEQAYRSDERFGLRALLTAEAERAEAEDENGSMALAAIADAHDLPIPQQEEL